MYIVTKNYRKIFYLKNEAPLKCKLDCSFLSYLNIFFGVLFVERPKNLLHKNLSLPSKLDGDLMTCALDSKGLDHNSRSGTWNLECCSLRILSPSSYQVVGIMYHYFILGGLTLQPVQYVRFHLA
jgi:hypothetical protein